MKTLHLRSEQLLQWSSAGVLGLEVGSRPISAESQNCRFFSMLKNTIFEKCNNFCVFFHMHAKTQDRGLENLCNSSISWINRSFSAGLSSIGEQYFLRPPPL